MASLNPCAEMRSSIEPAAAVVRQHDAAVVAEEQRRRLSRRRCRHALGRRADGLEKNLAGLRRAGNRLRRGSARAETDNEGRHVGGVDRCRDIGGRIAPVAETTVEQRRGDEPAARLHSAVGGKVGRTRLPLAQTHRAGDPHRRQGREGVGLLARFLRHIEQLHERRVGVFGRCAEDPLQ